MKNKQATRECRDGEPYKSFMSVKITPFSGKEFSCGSDVDTNQNELVLLLFAQACVIKGTNSANSGKLITTEAWTGLNLKIFSITCVWVVCGSMLVSNTRCGWGSIPLTVMTIFLSLNSVNSVKTFRTNSIVTDQNGVSSVLYPRSSSRINSYITAFLHNNYERPVYRWHHVSTSNLYSCNVLLIFHCCLILKCSYVTFTRIFHHTFRLEFLSICLCSQYIPLCRYLQPQANLFSNLWFIFNPMVTRVIEGGRNINDFLLHLGKNNSHDESDG